MKSIVLASLILLSASAFASPATVKALQSELKGKSLVCKSADPKVRTNSVYRGDDGFFTVSISKKGEVEIGDNGGQGYGFGNGDVKNIAMSNHILYLQAGDDGEQTLMLDFTSLGYDGEHTNCTAAALISEPDVADFSSTTVNCCVQ